MTNLPVQYGVLYGELKEEVRAIVSEIYFRVESEKLRGKWLVGKAIIDFAPHRQYGEAVVKKLSDDLDISERELYYCVKFVEKFPLFLDRHNEPELESLETNGKTPTWTKVKNELLTSADSCGHEETKTKRTEVEICTSCGKVISRREL